jgi:hypothetical protein
MRDNHYGVNSQNAGSEEALEYRFWHAPDRIRR